MKKVDQIINDIKYRRLDVHITSEGEYFALLKDIKKFHFIIDSAINTPGKFGVELAILIPVQCLVPFLAKNEDMLEYYINKHKAETEHVFISRLADLQLILPEILERVKNEETFLIRSIGYLKNQRYNNEPINMTIDSYQPGEFIIANDRLTAIYSFPVLPFLGLVSEETSEHHHISIDIKDIHLILCENEILYERIDLLKELELHEN